MGIVNTIKKNISGNDGEKVIDNCLFMSFPHENLIQYINQKDPNRGHGYFDSENVYTTSLQKYKMCKIEGVENFDDYIGIVYCVTSIKNEIKFKEFVNDVKKNKEDHPEVNQMLIINSKLYNLNSVDKDVNLSNVDNIQIKELCEQFKKRDIISYNEVTPIRFSLSILLNSLSKK